MKKKLFLFFILLTVLFIVWLIGGERVYAHFLKGGLNLVLAPFSSFRAEILVQNHHPILYFYDLNGPAEQDVISQNLEFLGLSVILLLAWFLLLGFCLPIRKVIRPILFKSAGFYVLQIAYFLLLFGKLEYAWASFIYAVFLHSFGILALFLILWDELHYQLFGFTSPKTASSSAK